MTRGEILGGRPPRASNLFGSSLTGVVVVGCFLIFCFALFLYVFCGQNQQEHKMVNIAGKEFEEVAYEPIDVVYTWVNGSDPRHTQMVNEAKIRVGLVEINENNETVDAATSNRFQDNNELRYSLRSLQKFAGWVRNIYIVTNGQVPYWLNLKNPRVKIIPHSEIFPNKSHLPTFSSPAIEVHLHQIPGLSKKFLYFNDDVVLGNYIWPSDFYTPATGQSLFFSWDVPNCASGCPHAWVGDGYCDKSCNLKECDFDGGDCVGQAENDRMQASSMYDYSYGEDEEYYGDEFPASDSCSEACSDFYIGDRYCDRTCNYAECGYDGGDCGWDEIFNNIYGLDGKDLFSGKGEAQLKVPEGALAVYVNFTSLVDENSTIQEGSFNNHEVIRTASISARYKTLLITLHRVETDSRADFAVVFKNDGSEETSEFVFTVICEEFFSEEADEVEGDNLDLVHLSKKKNIHEDHQHNGPLMGEVVSENDQNDQDDQDDQDGQDDQDDQDDGNDGNENDAGERVGGRNLLSLEPKRSSDKWTGQKRAQNKIDILNENNQLTKNYYPPSQPSSRKLLDIYGDSLKHVNRLLNLRYGRSSEVRKVPAHMPHFVQTEIMEDLQSIFPEEYDTTSSHPFRQGDDMQMMFAYKYFIKTRWEDFDLYEVLREDIDTNLDGIISHNELLTLAATILGAPVSETGYASIVQGLAEIKGVIHVDESGTSDGDWEEYLEFQGGIAEATNSLKITYRDISIDADVVDRLQEIKKKKPKYKFNTKGTDDVAFLMISEQDKEIVGKLDGIRRDRQKFLCLNDNMDHSNPESVATKQALTDLYEALVPLPSSFELPPGEENPSLYIEELLEMRDQQHELNLQYMACSLFFMFAFLIVFCLLRPKRTKHRE